MCRTATAGRVGQTRGLLSGLVLDEGFEVGIGKHAARALLALANADVAEIPGGDVGVERLDRATELGSGLRRSFEGVRRGLARLARSFGAGAQAIGERERAQKRGRRRERRGLGGL